ncbi:hypothetical protein BDW60DRAFT_184194 [Aspergillus nidulans var. acristatus]
MNMAIVNGVVHILDVVILFLPGSGGMGREAVIALIPFRGCESTSHWRVNSLRANSRLTQVTISVFAVGLENHCSSDRDGG